MIKIYFDDVLIDDDSYTALNNDYNLFTDNFKLGSVASNSFKLSVNKSMVLEHPNEVKIEDDNATFYLIVDSITEDKYVYNYTLVDKLINFNFNYDASLIIQEKESLEETCYLSDIWHDMCDIAGVEYDDDYTFLNDIAVGWYDNTIQARKYLSYIAELQGGYATILENGKQSFKPYKKASSKTIDIDECSDFILGEKKKITRVVYDNGIIKHDFGNETGSTVYIDSSNVYITDNSEVVENIYNRIKDFEFYLIDVPNCPMDSSIKAGDVIIFTDGINEYPTIAQYKMSFFGGWVGGYSLNVATNKQEETKLTGSNESIKSIKTEIDRTNTTLKIIAEEQSVNYTKTNNLVQDLESTNNKISLIEKEGEETREIVSELNHSLDGLSYTSKKIGGNNLIKNSDMANEDAFWLKHLANTYSEGDTPPKEIKINDYWYCTSNYENYVEGTMYIWDGSEWVVSSYSRKQLIQLQNLLSAVSSYEDEYTRKETESGRMLKFNADDESISSHLFTATSFADYKENEKYCSMSFKIKNSIKTGFIFIALAFFHETEDGMDTIINENLEGMYVKDIVLTPDDLTDLTNIELTTEVPKKSDFIPVYVGGTPPEDTTKKWMDNTLGMACILKEYNEETEEWELADTKMSCYDEIARNVYFWTKFVGGAYYPSTINYDNNEIKSVVAVIAQYGGFYLDTSPSKPEYLPKGWYWLDMSLGGFAWRAKYDGEEFVELEQTEITTEYILTHTVESPPFPSQYQVPPTGFFEIADLKMEWNNTSTAWSRYPGEVYGKNYKMDEKGFQITSGKNTMYIDEDEIRAKYGEKEIFAIDEDESKLNKVKTNEINSDSYTLKETSIYNKRYLVLY